MSLRTFFRWSALRAVAALAAAVVIGVAHKPLGLNAQEEGEGVDPVEEVEPLETVDPALEDVADEGEGEISLQDLGDGTAEIPETFLVRAPERTLSLTLDQCLALALENNLELDVERLNPAIALADARAEYGAFEPSLNVSAEYGEATRPRDSESVAATGIASTKTESEDYSLSIDGELPTGTEWSLSAANNGNRSTFNSFSTEFLSRVGVSVTQPLLRGGGLQVNLADLRVARKGKQAADAVFERAMMELVTDVSQAYYDLLFRQADLRSQRRSLALADRLLSDNQQRQEIGRMSRLDVTQAQSEAANRRRQVIQAERALWEAANELKRLIYRDLQNRHGQLMDAPFTPAPPTFEDPVLNARNALENRPDLREQWAAIEQAGIRLAVSRNNLLPTLNLEASYDLLGRDSGFAAGLRDAQENENNEWTVGVTLSIPLGQSAERAARDRARFQQSQALLRLKALEQDILREVDNAVLAVKSNRLSYEAARESTELARDTLEAEIERLNAGTTTTFVVSQLQRDLAVARTTELQALADWYKSLAELSRVEGTALSANGIVMQSWPERPAEIETSEPEFLDATRR